MNSINSTVAENLKLIREQRRLSLDAVAKMCAVSKSLLAQIEKGDANPTITTVWKIANGLRISFTSLLTRPERDFETVKIADLQILAEDEGHYRMYPLFPFDESRNFEIYMLEIDPGAFMQADAHPEGTQEFVTVFDGEIEIRAKDHIFHANSETAVRFCGDAPHSYRNTGDIVCRASMSLFYTSL